MANIDHNLNETHVVSAMFLFWWATSNILSIVCFKHRKIKCCFFFNYNIKILLWCILIFYQRLSYTQQIMLKKKINTPKWKETSNNLLKRKFRQILGCSFQMFLFLFCFVLFCFCFCFLFFYWKCLTAISQSFFVSIFTFLYLMMFFLFGLFKFILLKSITQAVFFYQLQFKNEQIQGAIMVASCLQVFIGSTGLIGFLLKYIGPVTIAPVVALVGIGILGPAADRASKHWGIAMLWVFFIIIIIIFFLKYI